MTEAFTQDAQRCFLLDTKLTVNSTCVARFGISRKCVSLLNALDPNIEWIEPAEFVGGGTYHGHVEVAQYLTQSRQAWAEIHSEPEEVIG